MPFLRLILILLAGLLLLLSLLAWLMARFLLRPPRMTDGKASWLLRRLTPLDIGLPFAPLTFSIRDEQSQKPLNLAAWWIPHENSHQNGQNGKTAILLHGYADAKVGAIAWAPLFHELGYNILALDLRAHGESGGQISSGGYWERHDLHQVINDLRARYPHETRHLTLFGASLGAAVAIAVASQRDDIDAVIMESPFIDFRHAASGHFNLLGIALPQLHRAAIWLSQKMAHANFSSIRPLDLIPKSPCPILLIQGQADVLTPPDDQHQLKRAIAQRPDGSTYWRLADVPHLMPLSADPNGYRQRLSEFLLATQSDFARRDN
ncbi:MAG TPA: alpha/beta hydrolase [Tepidisphaeraceae bacterium]|nr:alpha/beta hydrolase [Tepidisphaeraceae bacterium]